MRTNRKLTPRQEDVLRALIRLTKDNGFPPSMRELGDAVGISSSRTVYDHLVKLEDLGYIRRRRDRSRAVEILRAPDGKRRRKPKPVLGDPLEQAVVPIIGEVAAGSPILAQENREGELVVDPSMVRDPRSYVLRVRGDSMIEAHICDGDFVLIEPRQEARNGEVVVAYIDGDVTLKRFYKRDGYIELVPENSDLASILVTPDMGDIRVLGKLAGVIRRC